MGAGRRGRDVGVCFYSSGLTCNRGGGSGARMPGSFACSGTGLTWRTLRRWIFRLETCLWKAQGKLGWWLRYTPPRTQPNMCSRYIPTVIMVMLRPMLGGLTGDFTQAARSIAQAMPPAVPVIKIQADADQRMTTRRYFPPIAAIVPRMRSGRRLM